MATYKLVVEVVNACGLMPMDGRGSSSACVKLGFNGQWFRTAVKEKDLNPVWNESFYFDIYDPTNISHLSLKVYVFNDDTSSYNSKSFLGWVQIYGASIPPLYDDVIYHYYKLEKGSLLPPVSGELCLKVYIKDDPPVRASRHPLPTLDSMKFSVPQLQLQEEDRSPRHHDIPLVQEDIRSPRPRGIPLVHLKEITDNFSDERILGQGGFGVVYKGVLQNGEMVAVKKMASSLMPGLQKQFENEVYHLMMLNHTNIVRCVGYCYAEMAERLLCLEYLPKGSLDKYLSDESSGFDWSIRYKIIEGICYGLFHLHEQIDNPIIHLDLKPANILLDESLVPKITDFGLSRLLGQQQTICTSSRIGTFGYMAPEFLHGGTVTPKSDIFSLGVIIMEIITGHRDYPGVTETSSDEFIDHTLEKWRNVLQRSQGYGSLETYCKQIKRCIQVGLICVNPDRTKRPAVTKVISMIQGLESIDRGISNQITMHKTCQILPRQHRIKPRPHHRRKQQHLQHRNLLYGLLQQDLHLNNLVLHLGKFQLHAGMLQLHLHNLKLHSRKLQLQLRLGNLELNLNKLQHLQGQS